jgi:hypothetical protein
MVKIALVKDYLTTNSKEESMSERLEVKRTERGWDEHFIETSHCYFRRNTLLECGEERIVVVTIGIPEGCEQENGCGHYETMAFRAKKVGIYWVADRTKKFHFKSNRHLPREYFHPSPETFNAEANDMHETVVAEIIERLLHRA